MTERLQADPEGLARAASLLDAGRTVAFPTETVYGLGADATSDAAVAAIFAAKDRPRFNPLIVHLPDVGAVSALCDMPEEAERLAAAFWPGALTLVLPLRAGAGISPLVTAGLSTLAVRVPDHPLAQALLRGVGRPVAAPSANPSGRLSPTTAAHVLAGLDGRIGAVLDGGACGVGVESTIVGFDPAPVLLRPGGVPREALEACLGAPLREGGAGGHVTAPGQLASHYAPRGALRMGATGAREGEVLIGFGPVAGEVSLSPSGDLMEAAAALFPVLHRLDDAGVTRIAVAPIPETGLGLAINDRLRRAAAPRGQSQP
jgi:L-threonylcarbamoyladenylate synthase